MQLDADAEVVRLQTALRDLVALSAMPAAWIGTEPPSVAAGLADALVAVLQLDFAFVRLNYPDRDGAVDVRRGNAWERFPEWLESHATEGRSPGRAIVADAGDGSEPWRGLVTPIGIQGRGGLVAAASGRSDFPTAIDPLLLSLAANHAAIAFQNACLIQNRRRAAEELRAARDELEVKVAERTAELGIANDELSALRRVATLVAEGVRPERLFAVVAEEVARVVDVPLVSVCRYQVDGTATGCASFSPEGPLLPADRLSVGGASVLRQVRERCQPARIDDDSTLQGQIADTVRRGRLRSTVGVPIVAAGSVWGAVLVSTTEPEPLPQGTETRLAEFTQLLATAIENAESREGLERLAQEQAALGRVATLVAQGVRPFEIFSAVSEEVAHLFGTNVAGIVRFEHDAPAFVFVGVSKDAEGAIPIGTRWGPDDAVASAKVYRTGRSARLDAVDWSSVGGRVGPAGHRLGIASTVASPINVEGRLWGTATVAAEEPLPPDAGERLEKFAELVATAISNVQSKAELAASRRRIVAASDQARRQIERDLHDGTQQRLVSLGLAVRAAEASVPGDREDLRTELSGLATGLADAVEELQDLSRGIHPAILAQGGLSPALRSLARRSTIRVDLHVATDTRLPEPIEVAAYFVVCEALANAAKHSRASLIEVSLAERNGNLLVSIRDDGIGGADPVRGSGLIGLTDRVEALGGSIRVESRPGEGTHLIAELPLELDVMEES